MVFDTIKMAKFKKKSLYGYHIDKTPKIIALSKFIKTERCCPENTHETTPSVILY